MEAGQDQIQQGKNGQHSLCISERYAFGKFTFDTTFPYPEVIFRLIGDIKEIMHKLKLTRSQLTPKKQW